LTVVGFHTLRHTCASMLIESGMSPRALDPAPDAAADGEPYPRILESVDEAPPQYRDYDAEEEAPDENRADPSRASDRSGDVSR
jgi:hypothetical protein